MFILLSEPISLSYCLVFIKWPVSIICGSHPAQGSLPLFIVNLKKKKSFEEATVRRWNQLRYLPMQALSEMRQVKGQTTLSFFLVTRAAPNTTVSCQSSFLLRERERDLNYLQNLMKRLSMTTCEFHSERKYTDHFLLANTHQWTQQQVPELKRWKTH